MLWLPSRPGVGQFTALVRLSVTAARHTTATLTVATSAAAAAAAAAAAVTASSIWCRPLAAHLLDVMLCRSGFGYPATWCTGLSVEVAVLLIGLTRLHASQLVSHAVLAPGAACMSHAMVSFVLVGTLLSPVRCRHSAALSPNGLSGVVADLLHNTGRTCRASLSPCLRVLALAAV